MDELLKYLQTLEGNLNSSIIEKIKKTIDDECQKVFQTLKDGTPISIKDHKHLADSLKITKIETGKRYGWKIEYEGYNENGVPYSLIARSLNKGTPTIEGIHHIDKAIHKLKGLDNRIYTNVMSEIDLKEGGD